MATWFQYDIMNNCICMSRETPISPNNQNFKEDKENLYIQENNLVSNTKDGRSFQCVKM